MCTVAVVSRDDLAIVRLESYSHRDVIIDPIGWYWVTESQAAPMWGIPASTGAAATPLRGGLDPPALHRALSAECAIVLDQLSGSALMIPGPELSRSYLRGKTAPCMLDLSEVKIRRGTAG